MTVGGVLGKISHAISDVANDVVGDITEKTLGKAIGSLFEDGIGGIIGKGFSLTGGIGNIAEKLCDSLLPKELESLGDLVSLAIQYGTGNYPAAIEDGLDLLKDIPALLGNLGNNAATVPETAPWALDLLANTNAQNAAQASATSTSKQGETPSAGSEQTGTKAPNNSAVPTPKAAVTKPASGTSSAASTTPSAKNKGESVGMQEARKFLDAHQNPEDLMAQIRNGKIPTAVLDSQAGMMMLQDKMHQIQEMNALMTQMLKAMHEMTMSIIQNVRA